MNHITALHWKRPAIMLGFGEEDPLMGNQRKTVPVAVKAMEAQRRTQMTAEVEELIAEIRLGDVELPISGAFVEADGLISQTTFDAAFLFVAAELGLTPEEARKKMIANLREIRNKADYAKH